jgi:pyridoxal phosphate enzyme (YggS family)
MQPVSSNLESVHQRIEKAASRCQRDPADIQLLAVSKRQSAQAIDAAFTAGQHAFGENYLQEALEKIAAFPGKPINWHFIGPIQTNKAGLVAQHFDWVHSIHTLKIAQKLNSKRPEGLPPLNICLQINLGEEATKSGFTLAELSEVIPSIQELPNLSLRGLMALPAPSKDFAVQCESFAPIQKAFEQLRAECPTCDTLSIGTSADLEAAVTMGSTCVRIGTAIFGPREQ